MKRLSLATVLFLFLSGIASAETTGVAIKHPDKYGNAGVVEVGGTKYNRMYLPFRYIPILDAEVVVQDVIIFTTEENRSFTRVLGWHAGHDEKEVFFITFTDSERELVGELIKLVNEKIELGFQETVHVR